MYFSEDLFSVLGSERSDYRWIIIGPAGRGAHGSGTDGYGLEPPVSVLEIVEPEPNREGVSRLQFWFQNCRFRFRFRTGGFLRFRTASFFAVFCDSNGFSRFWFGTAQNRRFRHGFGSKSFEPEPNHGSRIDGFGSVKFSRFQFRTVTDGYGFGFNRRFGKPWTGLPPYIK